MILSPHPDKDRVKHTHACKQAHAGSHVCIYMYRAHTLTNIQRLKCRMTEGKWLPKRAVITIKASTHRL